MDKEYISDIGARNLADGIIQQAAKDYVKAIKFRYRGLYRECERFFRSEWFRCLTTIKGEYLIEKLREKAKMEIKEEMENLKKS